MGDRTLGLPPFGAKLKDKHYTGKKKQYGAFLADTGQWTRHLRWQLVARGGGDDDDGHGRGRCSSTKGIRTSAPVNSPDTARPPPAAS